MVNRLIIGLGLWVTVVLGHDWAFPDKDNYLRAGLWGASVIDRYIYLDGGQISQACDDDFYESYTMNDTLSIDCTTSWSPEDVEIRNIPRRIARVPVLSKQALLTDTKSKVIYAHGGYFPRSTGLNYNEFWSFRVDGRGGGSWESVNVDNPTEFKNSTINEGAAFASATDGGFIFGGAMGMSNFKGYETFNFTTKEWEEKWDAPYSLDGSLYGASAIFVEKYGAAGLVFVLGGVTRRFEVASGYANLSTVHFYDVADKKWYSQQTSGDVPPGWELACAAGVDDTGDNDSFEIFVYGGASVNLENPEIGTVYALSLPGFVWAKVSDDEDRHRASHACVALGSQLLSFGGVNLIGNTTDNWASKDPYPRGIAIFNLNTHTWEESYNAYGAEYETHKDIRAWYDNGGLNNIKWSDGVSTLFTPPIFDDEEPTEEDDDEESSSTSVGTITGGVVGGVAAISIIGTAVWLFLRKRNQSKRFSQHQSKRLAELEDMAEAGSPDTATWGSQPPVYRNELESEPRMARTELEDEQSSSTKPSPTPELVGSEVQR